MIDQSISLLQSQEFLGNTSTPSYGWLIYPVVKDHGTGQNDRYRSYQGQSTGGIDRPTLTMIVQPQKEMTRERIKNGNMDQIQGKGPVSQPYQPRRLKQLSCGIPGEYHVDQTGPSQCIIKPMRDWSQIAIGISQCLHGQPERAMAHQKTPKGVTRTNDSDDHQYDYYCCPTRLKRLGCVWWWIIRMVVLNNIPIGNPYPRDKASIEDRRIGRTPLSGLDQGCCDCGWLVSAAADGCGLSKNNFRYISALVTFFGLSSTHTVGSFVLSSFEAHHGGSFCS
jgi:hypothetical protein